MDEFIEAIRQAFAWLKNMIKRVIRGIISFVGHIVNWFKGLPLNRNIHVPFIGNAASPKFKQMLKEARVENVGIFGEQPVGVFKGVYDESTDEIIHAELISADGMDDRTKNIIRDEAVVVLS